VGTSLHLCRLVHWGYTLQKSTMDTKAAFLIMFYFMTFAGSILFSVLQLRHFQSLDEKSTTLKDFVAVIEGLPQLSGKEPVEQQLKEVLEKQTSQTLIGVSVCWDFQDQAWQVNEAIEAESAKADEAVAEAPSGDSAAAAALDEPTAAAPPALPAAPVGDGAEALRAGAEAEAAPGQPLLAEPPLPYAGGPRFKIFRPIDNLLGFAPPAASPKIAAEAQPAEAEEASAETAAAGATVPGSAEAAAEAATAPVATESGSSAKMSDKELLESLQTSSRAFAVFDSEGARDGAVAVLSKTGLKFKGARIRLLKIDVEPDTVLWQNFRRHPGSMPMKLVMAGIKILACLLAWTLLLYLPYVLWVTSSHFEEGQGPSGPMYMVLTFVIVGGNLLMYFICGQVSDGIGFHVEDARQQCYAVMYAMAIMLNVLLDVGLTVWLSYKVMAARGARTYGGLHLTEIGSVQELLDSYLMQQSMGFQLFNYCFPSTFLLPFLVEPIVAIWLPRHLKRFLLRSYPDIVGREAEKHLAIFTPMDTGRYADLLVNMNLAVLICFAPGGYMMPTLCCLLFAHIYIYAYDHYRVLRCVPAFCYANNLVAKTADQMLALPCGVILMCFVFKVNCSATVGSGICLNGPMLVLACFDALMLHVMLHLFILAYVVPHFGRFEHHASKRTYAEVAEVTPCNWFTSNPVYCLRSQHIYAHSPPCSFYVKGKEHTLKANPALGLHFEDGAAEPELI